MSGFEIAGVVLGAIPIIVELLKACKHAKSLLTVYRNNRRLITGLVNSLEHYRFIINDQVCNVIRGAGIPVSEEALWSGDAAKLLQNPELHINMTISDHLGARKFELFCVQLNLCQEALVDIVCMFDGLVARSAPEDDILQRLVDANAQSSTSIWKQTERKLKFICKQKDVDAKLRKLAEATARLKEPGLQTPHGFEFAGSVPSDISSRALRRLMASFELAQPQAHQLYRAIVRTLPRSCHERHSIHLFLDDRISALRPRAAADHRENRHPFRVELIGFAGDGNVDTCYTCDIAARSQDDNEVASALVAGKRVQLMVTSTEPTTEQVDVFCVCLRTVAKRQNALKLQLCMRRGLCYSEIADCLTFDEPSSQLQESVCLNEVIQKAASPACLPERNWGSRYRAVLALRLACSIMQLNRTHWLSKRCTSSTIYFKRTASKNDPFIPGAPPPFDAERPFITKSDPPGFLNEEPEHWVHELVLDLAIVLMEICSLETFDQWCARQSSPGPTDFGARREKADLWLMELENGADQNMTPHYREALQRCIEITSRTSYTFRDETVRKKVCEGVVKSLWANCKDWLV